MDAFVAKFDSLGRLVYLTYLGGSADDRGFGIAVDGGRNVYVTGSTNSPDFPVKGSRAQATLAAGVDAFAAKLGPAGDLVYSTYLGGSGADHGRGIAVDAAGNAYIAGDTTSWNFPGPHTVQSSLKGVQNAFVAGLDISGGLDLQHIPRRFRD